MNTQEIKNTIEKAGDLIADALAQYEVNKSEGLTHQKLELLNKVLEDIDSLTFDI